MRHFTILLAAYNRLDLLRQSVASALAQDWPELEVLVIDDGSEAETAEWLDEQAEADSRLRVVHQTNAGVAAARARGVEEARGDTIFILDSDDLVVDGALAKADAAFKKWPQADLIYSNNLHVFADGTEALRRYQSYPSNEAFLWATLVSPRVPFKHSGTCFRREVALELGNYDASLPIKIDIDFYLRFMHQGRELRHLDEALVAFHVHGEMMSRNRKKGIVTWNLLIDRYGPRNPLKRTYAKFRRNSAERLKSLYERFRKG